MSGVHHGDLYRILGIKLDATPEQIKRAYRKRAATAHPDAGGDAAGFQALKDAYDVLSDVDARAEYDRTGKWERRAADKGDAPAMLELAAAFERAMTELAKENAKIENVDVAKAIKETLEERLHQAREMGAPIVKTLDAMERAAPRFKAKAGPNLLNYVARAQIERVANEVKKFRACEAALTRAIEIVDSHEFEWTRTIRRRQQWIEPGLTASMEDLVLRQFGGKR